MQKDTLNGPWPWRKKTIISTLVAAFVLTATAAFAQTAGTITVSGTTPEAFSITNGSDGTVSSTIALGTLTPASGSTLTQGSAQIRLRSNKAYKVTAQGSALSFTNPGTADGGNPMTLSDVGFGILSVSAAGANVAAGHTDTIALGFDVSGGWPSVTNGVTPGFSKTLNDITAAAAQVISGGRISAKGNISTNDNFVQVTFGVATLPQYFTPNSSFSTTITLTISSN